MARRRDQRTTTLTLKILDHADYGSRTHSAATDEVMLALTVLLRFVCDPAGLHEYWRKAQDGRLHPWASARHAYYRSREPPATPGWDAPV